MVDETLLDFYKKVAYNLETERKAKKITQEKLSNLSGVERSKISRIENFREDFQFSTILRLAVALKISAGKLLNLEIVVPTDHFLNKNNSEFKKSDS